MGLFRRRRTEGRGVADDDLLLVPIEDSPEATEGWRVAEADETLAFLLIQDDDGLLVLPAFTNESELTRWNPEGSPYAGLYTRDLIDLLANSDWDRIVVDGAGDKPFAITRAEAIRRVGGLLDMTVREGTTMLIGDPADRPPAGMLDALREGCGQVPAIAETYVFQTFVDGDEQPTLAVGLRFEGSPDPSEVRSVVQQLVERTEPTRWGYEHLDFQVLDDEMLELVSCGREPVFRR